MSRGYDMNEPDINKVLNYLKIHRPELANRDTATKILEVMYITAHRSVAHGEIVDLDETIEQAIKQVLEEEDQQD
jgi:hypothetical protein